MLSDIAGDLASVGPQSAQPATGPEVLGLLSRRLVQLLRHRAGRGPTQAKGFWAGDDVVLVLFGGGFTKAEKTLWDHGRAQTALAYRHCVQETLEDAMSHEVEAVTGRHVTAVLSCARQEPDVMAEIFLLEPHGDRGSAGAGDWDAGGLPASQPFRGNGADGAAG